MRFTTSSLLRKMLRLHCLQPWVIMTQRMGQFEPLLVLHVAVQAYVATWMTAVQTAQTWRQICLVGLSRDPIHVWSSVCYLIRASLIMLGDLIQGDCRSELRCSLQFSMITFFLIVICRWTVILCCSWWCCFYHCSELSPISFIHTATDT